MFTCIKCGWIGDVSELICIADDEYNFKHCPDCEGVAFDEEDDQ